MVYGMVCVCDAGGGGGGCDVDDCVASRVCSSPLRGKVSRLPCAPAGLRDISGARAILSPFGR
jgi:hypothetical protein